MSPSDSEILEDHTIPGDPDRVAELAQWFRQVADELGSAKTRLQGIGTSGWVGNAADAFNASMQEFPQQLEAVFGAYDHLAWALWTYENQLRELQHRAHKAAVHIETARQNVHQAERQRDAGDPDGSLQAAVDRAKDDLRAGKNDAEAIHSEFKGLVRWCQKQVEDAKGTIGNDFGGAVARWGGDAVAIGKGIWDKVTTALHDLPGDIAAFVKDPTPEHFMKIVEDATTVLSALAMAFPAFAVLGFVALAANVAQFAGHAWEAARGIGGVTWSQVAFDALACATEGVAQSAGRAARIGEKLGGGESALAKLPSAAPASRGGIVAGITTKFGSGPGSLAARAGTTPFMREPMSWGKVLERSHTIRDVGGLGKSVVRDLFSRYAARGSRGPRLPVSTAVTWNKGISSAYEHLSTHIGNIADSKNLKQKHAG